MGQSLIPPFGKKVKLKDFDANFTKDYKSKKTAKKELRRVEEKLIEYQELLFAEGKHAILIVLQAMDAGGKDGTIKHVMGAINPQGCDVKNFRVPTPEESAHDFLWRYHQGTPKRGKIVIFNRSYYEEVLVVRVHDLVPKREWSRRYEHINNFERMLIDNGTHILKFYLHISKGEQRRRFERRLNRPNKHWKFSHADLREREYWDEYKMAFEEIFHRCHTEIAPWHIVPADNKWYRNLVIGHTILEKLESLNMRYPEPEPNLDKIIVDG